MPAAFLRRSSSPFSASSCCSRIDRPGQSRPHQSPGTGHCGEELVPVKLVMLHHHGAAAVPPLDFRHSPVTFPGRPWVPISRRREDPFEPPLPRPFFLRSLSTAAAPNFLRSSSTAVSQFRAELVHGRLLVSLDLYRLFPDSCLRERKNRIFPDSCLTNYSYWTVH
jgi:hypothetical protein